MQLCIPVTVRNVAVLCLSGIHKTIFDHFIITDGQILNDCQYYWVILLTFAHKHRPLQTQQGNPCLPQHIYLLVQLASSIFKYEHLHEKLEKTTLKTHQTLSAFLSMLYITQAPYIQGHPSPNVANLGKFPYITMFSQYNCEVSQF